MDEFNDDEKEPPTWMDKDFLQMVLRGYEKDQTIVVNSIKIQPGSAKGDHWASIMFRVIAEFESNSSRSNSRSVIVKTVPEVDGFKKEMLDAMKVFETEIRMYANEVPNFEAVLRKYGDNTRLCAKILYHSLKPRKVIVFEDLVPLGYVCIRDRYNNLDEVKACLSKVAKWHAVSYKLAAEGDESVKMYDEGLLSKPREEQPEFITGGMQMLVDTVFQIEGLEKYAEKLQALEASLIPKCNEIFKAYSRGIKGLMVLNHGDLHSKNVMFKYDPSQKLEDVMLVDFQISCYASAVVDITYIIYMIFTEEMRKNHREELIYFYFSIFLETLKNIEYTGELPTLVDLYIDSYRFKEYELWIVATFLPLVYALMAKKDSVETEDLLSSNDAQRRMYFNPSFIEELKWLLPRLLQHGFLE